MAGTFISTGSYSNLTRLELEQLRKADFYAGAKALTVGDSGLSPEGVVGKGDINAEPFLTGPTVLLDDVYSQTPPSQPGTLLGTTTQFAAFPSETAQWFGPTLITDGFGSRSSSNIWQDLATDFTLAGVTAGDLLLIRETQTSGAILPGTTNSFAVGTISVITATTVQCTNINNNGGTTFPVDTASYAYYIVRPTAVQLFAVPGSGPTGREQTFLTVVPNSTLHSTVGPTTDQINAERVRNLIPASYGLNASVDRADSVYGAPAPRTDLRSLGYRVVLYPDNGAGAPNLAAPITTFNPVIDPSITSTDQRFTIDYKAGVIRFSAAPALGGSIKVSGGVNGTTGRLNLYAVFWAADTSLTKGTARGLRANRHTTQYPYAPGKIYFDSTISAWRIGSTTGVNSFYARALSSTEDSDLGTEFGTTVLDPFLVPDRRYFIYRQAGTETGKWKFLKSRASNDSSSWWEMEVADKTQYTVGDITYPPQSPADFTADTLYSGTLLRKAETPFGNALRAARSGEYGTVHVRRGKIILSTPQTIHIPPGVILEGEGDMSIIESQVGNPTSTVTTLPTFKFGPNMPWGVYDADEGSTPTIVDFVSETGNSSAKVEGYDVVWNPVRRVWAIAWADVTTQGLYLNEMNTDGTMVYPGLGVEIKQTVTPLFTNASPNSSNHTEGHYPRLAHYAGQDTYYVVWVEEFTSGTAGSIVKTRTVKSNIPGIGSPYVSLGTTMSVTSSTFSDHPSVAIDNGPALTGLVSIHCWSYNSTLSTSRASRFRFAFGAGSAGAASNNSDSLTVYSSTDVKADDNGGFQYVYSQRMHPTYSGTNGSFNSSGSFTDSGYGTFAGLGIVPGSKFMYQGVPRSVTGLATFDLFSNVYSGLSTTYGMDGTITSTPGFALDLKADTLGTVYTGATAWRYANSALGNVVAGLSTLTDATQNFITQGVANGDWIVQGVDPTIRRQIIGVTATILTISGTFPSTFNTNNYLYKIFHGRTFNWSVVAPSRVRGVRYSGELGVETSPSFSHIAGYPTTPDTTSYIMGQIEPDFVRLSRGNGNWIVTYQAFKSTSFFSQHSFAYANEFYLNYITGGGIPLDLDDCLGYYRQHISTCAVVLNDLGQPVSTPAEDGTSLTLNTLSPLLQARASRDSEIHERSLGAREPITSRPNYYPNNTTRFGTSFELEIAAANFCFRVDTSSPGNLPSLIPAVSWSGSDWTIVSPAKRVFRSYVGNYIVSGGVVYLGDLTFYFGDNTTSFDGAFRPKTVAVLDKIYFPSNGTFGTIASVYNEHIVTLSESDAALLNTGALKTAQIEWVLVRNAPSSTGGGIKNPGFRVAEDGRLIVSSTFLTHADPLEDFSTVGAERVEMLSRKKENLQALSSDVTTGYNLGSSLNTDPINPGSRYIVDVHFKGVAVGAPVGCNGRVLNEQPKVAMAWGENLFAFVDHVVEGYSGSEWNQLRAYRQSFGPYRSGMRNLKLTSTSRTSFVDSTTWRELKVLSRQHILTRHGRPNGSTGFFATDGYRNCFGSVLWTNNLLSNSNFYTDTSVATAVTATYTDALGRSPITVYGPQPVQRDPVYGGRILSSGTGTTTLGGTTLTEFGITSLSGTVTVTKGSRTVTGVGTSFTAYLATLRSGSSANIVEIGLGTYRLQGLSGISEVADDQRIITISGARNVLHNGTFTLVDNSLFSATQMDYLNPIVGLGSDANDGDIGWSIPSPLFTLAVATRIPYPEYFAEVVESVTSNTSATLLNPWRGETFSGVTAQRREKNFSFSNSVRPGHLIVSTDLDEPVYTVTSTTSTQVGISGTFATRYPGNFSYSIVSSQHHRNELCATGTYDSNSYRYLMSSAPKVIWDGRQFVFVWAEGGGAGMSEKDTPIICISTFSGEEVQRIQVSDLVDPYDPIAQSIGQAVRVGSRSSLSVSGGDFTIVDVAYSGRVYAVAWVCGNDPDNGKASNLGVTLFEGVGFGGPGIATPNTLSSGSDGIGKGTTTFKSLQDFDGDQVAIGDIVTIHGNTSASGRYTVTSVRPVSQGTAGVITAMGGGIMRLTGGSGFTNALVGDPLSISRSFTSANNGVFTITAHINSTTIEYANSAGVTDAYNLTISWDLPALTLDNPVPTATALPYTVCRTIIPGGAASYVLSVSNKGAVGLTPPKIVWDGKNFAIALCTAFPDLTSGANTTSLSYVSIPETGLAHPMAMLRQAYELNSNSPTSASLMYGVPAHQNSGADNLVGDRGLGTIEVAVSPRYLTMGTTQHDSADNGNWPNVKVGDTLVVTKTWYNGGANTGSHYEDNGWYMIDSVDYNAGTFTCGHTFLDSTGSTSRAVYGVILRAGMGDFQNLVIRSSGSPGGDNFLPDDISPNLRRIWSGDYASTATVRVNNNHNRVQSLVYNEVDDSYAILFTSGNGNKNAITDDGGILAVSRFHRDTLQAEPPAILASSTIVSNGGASISLNGQTASAPIFRGTSLISLSGIWTGTVVFEASNNGGTNYYLVNTTATTGIGTGQVNTVINGSVTTYYQLPAQHFTHIRVRATAWTAGTLTVNLYGQDEIYNADMAWNGRHYMAVWATETTGSPISYALLNQNLVVESTGTINSGAVESSTSVLGTSYPWQKPGEIYDSHNPVNAGTGGLHPVYPRCHNVQVRWNNRLNRWVVSGSFVWNSSMQNISDELFDYKGMIDATFSATAATGTLTFIGIPTNGNTITTGTKTYTFQTVLTNVNGNVLIGGSASSSLNNLIAAINLAAGAGSTYAALTTANTFVSAVAGDGDTMDVTALVPGTAGNSIATTEVSASSSWAFPTLIGGTTLGNGSSGFGLSNEIRHGHRISTTNSISSVSGANIIGLASTDGIGLCRPGCKLMVVNTTSRIVLGIATILSVASDTTGPLITLDMPSIPGSWLSAGAGSLFVLPREDIFCWTLGYDNPLVQFEDADDCFLENVTMSGNSDIEERWKNMARPVWRSGGPPIGYINGTGSTSLSPATTPARMRSAQYGRAFLTPTLKIETPRLINVRSHTKYRYGHGFVAGAPTMDRATFRNALRRG